jgi:hypothetical protein
VVHADGLAHLNGGYQLSAEVHLGAKLVGMSVQMTAAGHVQLLLPGSGDRFLWNGPTLSISNILLGESGLGALDAASSDGGGSKRACIDSPE